MINKRWAGHVARMNDRWGTYRVLVWRLVWKRPFGRPKPRREDSNNFEIEEVGWRT